MTANLAPTAGSRRRPSICLLNPDRVAIRSGATITVVSVDDIILAESSRNTTVIVTRLGELRVRETLRAVLELLGLNALTRIHRRIAVNRSRIRQVVGRGNHRLEVVLDDGRCLAVGREFQREVRMRFGPSG